MPSVAPATPAPATAIGYYTAREVARLAGVSPRKVGSWARYGIIVPSVSTRPNIYSYADTGEAMLANYLVKEGKKPRDVREIVHMLRAKHGQWPLATAPLAHDGSLLVAWDEEQQKWVSVDKPGHDVIGATLLNLKLIRNALGHGGWAAIRTRREHIEVDPDRHSGDPVIRGRRLATALVAALAKQPDGRATLKSDYDLSDAQIDDAVGYEEDVAALVAAA